MVAPVGVRSEAKDGNGADAGRTRAAEGKACRQFFAPEIGRIHFRFRKKWRHNQLGVKRYETKNGKRRGISLHKRLDYLPSKYMSYKDKLKAIKWLGNAGSHGESDVEMRDVIDAYYLVQHILEEIYNQKTKKLNELTKLINKKKGPRK